MTDIQLLWLAFAGLLVLNVAFFLHKRKDNKEIMASMGKHLMEDSKEKIDRLGRRDTLSDRIREIERQHEVDPHLLSYSPMVIALTEIHLSEDGMAPTRKELKDINKVISALLSHLKLEVDEVPEKPAETKLVKKKASQ